MYKLTNCHPCKHKEAKQIEDRLPSPSTPRLWPLSPPYLYLSTLISLPSHTIQYNIYQYLLRQGLNYCPCCWLYAGSLRLPNGNVGPKRRSYFFVVRRGFFSLYLFSVIFINTLTHFVCVERVVVHSIFTAHLAGIHQIAT